MSFLIQFQHPNSGLKTPVNRNVHDHFYWDFSHEVSEWSRKNCGASEEHWHSQKTIHDLYEIYNAPHVPDSDRSQKAASYVVDKEFQLILERKIQDTCDLLSCIK